MPNLVYSLCHLNYPRDSLDIWVVDDGSTVVSRWK
ncbi:hypothetical protein [Nostoc sp.]